jgi:cytochrome c biogenesis protein CcdA
MKGGDMNVLALAHANDSISSKSQTTRQQLKTKFQVAGAATGLAGGVVAGISGGLLTAASWLSANEGARQWLSTAGSTLLVLTIPLIILGAFCLDWLEKNQPQRRSKIVRDDDDGDEQ